jgi:hypothetical protein
VSAIKTDILTPALATVYDLQELWVAAIDLAQHPVAARVTISVNDLMSAIVDYQQDPRPWREERVRELTQVYSRYVARIIITEDSIDFLPSQGHELYAIRPQ